MDLSNLQPAKGSTHSRKRVGRGEGLGHGSTSTRGHKGAQSRSTTAVKSALRVVKCLQRRVPKFGFTNPNRVEYKGLNLDTLQSLVEAKKLKSTITFEDLVNNGLVGKKELVKVLGRGECTMKLNITAHAFSKSAVAAIEAQGGTATTL